MKFKLHRLDHYEMVEDIYEDVHCTAFYFPHRDMSQAFSEWFFEHGGQEAFLKYRGPIVESVEEGDQND